MDEKLIEMLGEELSNQVKEKIGENKIVIANNGTWVPAEKHEQLKSDYKEINGRLDKANDDLKGFADTSNTIEELKSKLEESNKQYEEYKTEVGKKEVNRTKKAGLEKLFKDSGALEETIDLLVSTIDLENVQIDSKNNVVDGELLVNPIKESRKSLFTQQKIHGERPPQGDSQDINLLDDQAFFDTMMAKQK